MKKILSFLGLGKSAVESVEVEDNSYNPLVSLSKENLDTLKEQKFDEDNGLVLYLRMCWQFRKSKMSQQNWDLMIVLTNLYFNSEWKPSVDSNLFKDSAKDEYAVARDIAKKVKHDLSRLK